MSTHLEELVSDTTDGVVLCNGDVRENIVVANVGSQRISMLVCRPLPLRYIRVPSADKLVLHMLEALVEREPVRSHTSLGAGNMRFSRMVRMELWEQTTGRASG
jgi:hypothetical protein